ncbi:hypothetical protein EVAR_25793_1 [Eumeta japonica]|uniref:DUF5641 domain-containing protein n=1 Tax=Eumeta variegata TaxID=151549 RepID=A0A4C1VST2_EUMVA|nr:hypothetical protein EVAR_25793_1 [Eumeta japonica]
MDNAPPLQGPLGVTIRVHPGMDGSICVAQMKTKNSIYDRPIVKLCPLPTQIGGVLDRPGKGTSRATNVKLHTIRETVLQFLIPIRELAHTHPLYVPIGFLRSFEGV